MYARNEKLLYVKLFINCDSTQFLDVYSSPNINTGSSACRSAVDFRKVQGSIPRRLKTEIFQNLLKQRRVPDFREIQTVYCRENSGFFATSLSNPLPSIKAARSRITYSPQSEHLPQIVAKFHDMTIYTKVLEYIRKMYREDVKRREIPLRTRR